MSTPQLIIKPQLSNKENDTKFKGIVKEKFTSTKTIL
jgi:hypothetical protein